MATLTMTEYRQTGFSGYPNANQLSIYPGANQVLAEQNMALTTSSQQFSALQTNTTLIELCGDTDAYLAFGTNPTAVVNYHYLPAKTVRYYAVNGSTLVAALT